jgi:tRNA (guanine37-N1)-methyltransferase
VVIVTTNFPRVSWGDNLRIDIITIFPEYLAPLKMSLIGKAVERGEIVVAVHDLRTWTHDVHRTVDDSPFGGGPGMVMKPEPWGEALDALVPPAPASSPGPAPASNPGPAPASGPAPAPAPGPPTPARLVVPTPAGALFNQATAAELAGCEHLVFACGRYEGIDDRVVQDARRRMIVHELSIGDYVLAGGESAVLVMVEAICRLKPGVLGNAQSAADDSFGGAGGEHPMSGLVEGPAYTRPRSWRDLEVPPVLLSGDHAAIARWRRDQSLRRTARNRPDLAAKLAEAAADDHDRQVLSEAGFAVGGQDVAH